MQDKNIDEIFRSKLDGFEIEPTAGVWPGIVAEMNSAEHKKARVPYLSTAASIIILLTAGIYFIPKKIKTSGKQHLANNIAKVTTEPSVIKDENVLEGRHNSVIQKQTTIALHHYKAVNSIPVKKVSPEIESRDSDKTDGLMTASVSQRDHEQIDPVVPDVATQLSITQPITQTPGFIIKPALVTAQLPSVENPDNGPIKTSHKIRSLGGLINAVVAKLDKRRDKIIEFTDDDDGTNVTGINLGIIKIKKDK